MVLGATGVPSQEAKKPQQGVSLFFLRRVDYMVDRRISKYQTLEPVSFKAAPSLPFRAILQFRVVDGDQDISTEYLPFAEYQIALYYFALMEESATNTDFKDDTKLIGHSRRHRVFTWRDIQVTFIGNDSALSTIHQLDILGQLECAYETLANRAIRDRPCFAEVFDSVLSKYLRFLQSALDETGELPRPDRARSLKQYVALVDDKSTAAPNFTMEQWLETPWIDDTYSNIFDPFSTIGDSVRRDGGGGSQRKPGNPSHAKMKKSTVFIDLT